MEIQNWIGSKIGLGHRHICEEETNVMQNREALLDSRPPCALFATLWLMARPLQSDEEHVRQLVMCCGSILTVDDCSVSLKYSN